MARGWRRATLVVWGLVGGLATPALCAPALVETWQDVPPAIASDGSPIGRWTVAFAGYGTVERPQTQPCLILRPGMSRSADETHAALVTSGQSFRSPHLLATCLTRMPLRRNTPPNPWEVAWLVWDYQDLSHYYYFILKPNGWELGKVVPSPKGPRQRFLLTGNVPYRIGNWHRIEIRQQGNVIRMRADNRALPTATDPTDPYLEGRVGLYTEDAEVAFGPLSVEGE